MNVRRNQLVFVAVVLILLQTGFALAQVFSTPNPGHPITEIAGFEVCSGTERLTHDQFGGSQFGVRCVPERLGPSGTSGTVTSVAEASGTSGITLSSSPITSTGSIAINFAEAQARITGSCSPVSGIEQGIRGINIDGTVTCDPIEQVFCFSGPDKYSVGGICRTATQACGGSTKVKLLRCGSGGTWGLEFTITGLTQCITRCSHA